jgi:hypothetical protein
MVEEESLSIELLLTAFRRLVVQGDYLDTTSEKGYHACQTFLEAINSAAQTLSLRPTPRAYRSAFSGIYRSLFEGDERSYRVDILEAGTSGGSVIWANGEEFQLHQMTLHSSHALWDAWMGLGNVLHRWIAQRVATRGPQTMTARGRNELCAALNRLDAAWATFEQAYVTDLMRVQDKAWALVAAASSCEARLAALEGEYTEEQLVQLPAYGSARRDLVRCIARLNSVANTARKGRDDLSVDILESATEVLRRCDVASLMSSTGGSLNADTVGPAAVLASRVVDAFQALRSYLGQVQHHRDEMVPNLCQNEGLVTRLVEWEKSWEIGARHVRDAEQLAALCHLAAGLRSACCVAPSFTEMVTDCDPELFMSLPRVAWLYALANPSGPVAELLRRLLPHRFNTSAGQPAQVSSGDGNEDVQALIGAFRNAAQCLETAWPSSFLSGAPSCAKEATWELFIRRAVGGAGGAEDPYACLAPEQRQAAAAVVEGFMNELEGWSMELQRHNPEDWNECVDLLVQCLKGDRQAKAGIALQRLDCRDFVV